jgi:protein phosphatase
MRTLIIADIHGNVAPLEKVLKEETYDLLICLGDMVDYGPFPNEVVQIIKENANLCVMGNHDYSVAFDKECPGTTREFKEITYKLREYFSYQIDSENLQFIKSLPYFIEEDIDNSRIFAVHASAKDPLGDYVTFDLGIEFIKEKMIINDNYKKVLYGHTHRSGIIKIGDTEVINPGSLGFPRERHPFPTYGIIENGKFEVKRVSYDREKLIREIKNFRIPDSIITKLLGEE